jgi:GDP-L-fucose synthase
LSESKLDAVVSDLNVNNIEEANTYLSRFGVSADSVEIWGTGTPRREFLWSEDMADACVFLMQNRNFSDTHNITEKEIRNTHINIGTGIDVSIKELAEIIKNATDFKGKLVFNSDKPDGTLRKLTDVSKLQTLGWKHKIDLEEGISKLYNWYLNPEK